MASAGRYPDPRGNPQSRRGGDKSCEDRRVNNDTRDGLVAAAVAGIVSGAPSTACALVHRHSVLAATAPRARCSAGRAWRAGLAAHVALVALVGCWCSPRAATRTPRGSRARSREPRSRPSTSGVIGRRVPRSARSRKAPQWLDHVVFGATFGAVLDACDRKGRARPECERSENRQETGIETGGLGERAVDRLCRLTTLRRQSVGSLMSARARRRNARARRSSIVGATVLIAAALILPINAHGRRRRGERPASPASE